MVSLGLIIGLAFLPAILSLCGPVVCVSVHDLGKGDRSERQPSSPAQESTTSPMGSSQVGSSPDTREAKQGPKWHKLVESKEPETPVSSATPVLKSTSWDSAEDAPLQFPVSVMPDTDEDDLTSNGGRDSRGS